MEVQFRECDWFNLWIWVEFREQPVEQERQYLAETLNSWFLLGKLGGFNAENLQVQESGADISYLNYDEDMANDSLGALMHNMGEVEYQENWARVWLDLGTSDAVAIDVLINALRRLSEEYVQIDRLIIGGQNEDWPVPTEREDAFYDMDYDDDRDQDFG